MRYAFLVLFALLVWVLVGLLSINPQGIRIMKNIAYGSHSRHVLDIYIPSEPGPHPIVVFIPGGGWKDGHTDRYPHLGAWLAAHNILGVFVNHRLSPEVVHPAHTEDCAAALAWIYENIGQYGGDRERLYLTGYSAGGHLAALVVTNPEYLKKHNLSPDIIKGVVTMSGVYRVNYTLDLTGYGGAFPWGCRDEASPITHVRKGLPPWVVIYALNDLRTLDWQAKKFYFALREKGVDARLVILPSDHELLTENLVNDRQAKKLIAFFRGSKCRN